MARLSLAQASPAQIDAAFKVVFPEILQLAHYYAQQVHVPFVDVERLATEKLSTREAKAQIMKILDDAITAAEKIEHPA